MGDQAQEHGPQEDVPVLGTFPRHRRAEEDSHGDQPQDYQLDDLEDVDEGVPLHEKPLPGDGNPEQLHLADPVLRCRQRRGVVPAPVKRGGQLLLQFSPDVEGLEGLRELVDRDESVRPVPANPVLRLVFPGGHLFDRETKARVNGEVLASSGRLILLTS